jgi:hypothetical protein
MEFVAHMISADGYYPDAGSAGKLFEAMQV